MNRQPESRYCSIQNKDEYLNTAGKEIKNQRGLQTHSKSNATLLIIIINNNNFPCESERL